jgi:hypothetical protein
LRIAEALHGDAELAQSVKRRSVRLGTGVGSGEDGTGRRQERGRRGFCDDVRQVGAMSVDAAGVAVALSGAGALRVQKRSHGRSAADSELSAGESLFHERHSGAAIIPADFPLITARVGVCAHQNRRVLCYDQAIRLSRSWHELETRSALRRDECDYLGHGHTAFCPRGMRGVRPRTRSQSGSLRPTGGARRDSDRRADPRSHNRAEWAVHVHAPVGRYARRPGASLRRAAGRLARGERSGRR